MIATITGDCQLGVASPVRFVAALGVFGAFTPNEVTTDMVGLQAGGIHRRQRYMTIRFHDPDGAVEKLLGRTEAQQTLGGFLECCEMGHGLESKNFTETGAIVQDLYNAPILGFEEHSQDQADKELR